MGIHLEVKTKGKLSRDHIACFQRLPRVETGRWSQGLAGDGRGSGKIVIVAGRGVFDQAGEDALQLLFGNFVAVFGSLVQ